MHFIRLLRPVNLLIIALTMIGIQYYVSHHVNFSNSHFVDFGLLIFSTLLIAGAGNIINDYFDVRADRVNKPNRVIISKYIKRRWAIVSHWTFNAIAFVVGLYLGWKYQNYWFVIIHFTSITTLWWYSVRLKKHILIGNLAVSFLSSLVILLTLLFMLQSNFPEVMKAEVYATEDPHLPATVFGVIVVFMGVGFVLNLCREIVKDVEDIPGDKLIQAHTLPMAIGVRTSLSLVGTLLIALCVLYFLGSYVAQVKIAYWEAWPITLAAMLSGIVGILAFFPFSKRVALVKHTLKLIMLAGLIYLYL